MTGQLSNNVIGRLSVKPIGAFQSAFLSQLNSRLLLVKWLVIICHYSVVVSFV